MWWNGRLRFALEQMEREVPKPQVLHREGEVVGRDLLHPEHLDVEAHRFVELSRVHAHVVEAGRSHRVADPTTTRFRLQRVLLRHALTSTSRAGRPGSLERRW